ncbi:MAG: SRPBCC domain-containing protein [Polyangiaceae bacterium]
MRFADTFKLTTPSDCEIQVTRTFAAPRALIFDALTKPELVKRWLLGPPGWSMPVCEIELRVGGAYRYQWRFDASGNEMAMRGTFKEIVAPEKLVATEKFDDAWYPGEALDTTLLVERDGKTTMTLTVLYESKRARDTATRSGMEQGMAAGYDKLEELLLASQAAGAVTPQVLQTEAQLLAVIQLTIPRSEMRTVMGPGIAELMAAVKSQGIPPAGPWFVHHLRIDPATFDFEICVPVPSPVTPVGRVKPGVRPAMRVAQSVLHGGYEKLGAAWGEFEKWLVANGHQTGPDLYECYAVGPGSDPDQANWRTELSKPLIG